MVDSPRCLATAEVVRRARVAGGTALAAAFCLGLAVQLPAQQPKVHYWHHGAMPPGAIGSLQLQRGGPLPGYFQPVEIVVPPGVAVSFSEYGAFGEPSPVPVRVGLLVGQVYRIRLTNIPLHEGLEVFPTIEVIDRLYPPPGQERRFPVFIEVTREDLDLALDGKFVTRVIYLEDPEKALPVGQLDKQQSWFEAAPGQDPLAVADQLGRPMAILRMGARLPTVEDGMESSFLFGCPPLVKLPQPKLPGTPGGVPGELLPDEPGAAGRAEPVNLPRTAAVQKRR
jgi:hypothetical protein